MMGIRRVLLAFAVLGAALVAGQTQRLIINSFDNGPSTAAVNALGNPQGATGCDYWASEGRLHMQTYPGQTAVFSTALSSPEEGCLALPPQQQIETFLSFRIQMPAGIDMSIVLQTGTNGCGGRANDSAVVRFSEYNDLSGQITYVRIPLTDFDPTQNDYLNGRVRAIVFVVPAIQEPVEIQFDELQLISRPRTFPLSFQNSAFQTSFRSGPPGGQWGPSRPDSRCGPGFDWAGCDDGGCCSTRGWCGFTPMHCLTSQGMMFNRQDQGVGYAGMQQQNHYQQSPQQQMGGYAGINYQQAPQQQMNGYQQQSSQQGGYNAINQQRPPLNFRTGGYNGI